MVMSYTLDDYASKVFANYGIELEDYLGRGAYGKVMRCSYKAPRKEELKLAVKEINLNKAPDDFVKKFLPREISILCQLDHANIVNVRLIMEVGFKIYIFMDLADGGELLEHIKSHGRMQERKVVVMFGQIVDAIAYCHGKDICHRDMKCENLMLHANLSCMKIVDFGFARYCYDLGTRERVLSETYCGSAAYAPPEVLQGLPYDPKLFDVWSMGVILYIMLCGSMPYDDSNLKKMVTVQLSGKLGFPARVRGKISTRARHLIRKMLNIDIEKRYDINMVKQDLFFNRKKSVEN